MSDKDKESILNKNEKSFIKDKAKELAAQLKLYDVPLNERVVCRDTLAFLSENDLYQVAGFFFKQVLLQVHPDHNMEKKELCKIITNGVLIAKDEFFRHVAEKIEESSAGQSPSQEKEPLNQEKKPSNQEKDFFSEIHLSEKDLKFYTNSFFIGSPFGSAVFESKIRGMSQIIGAAGLSPEYSVLIMKFVHAVFPSIKSSGDNLFDAVEHNFIVYLYLIENLYKTRFPANFPSFGVLITKIILSHDWEDIPWTQQSFSAGRGCNILRWLHDEIAFNYRPQAFLPIQDNRETNAENAIASDMNDTSTISASLKNLLENPMYTALFEFFDPQNYWAGSSNFTAALSALLTQWNNTNPQFLEPLRHSIESLHNLAAAEDKKHGKNYRQYGPMDLSCITHPEKSWWATTVLADHQIKLSSWDNDHIVPNTERKESNIIPMEAERLIKEKQQQWFAFSQQLQTYRTEISEFLETISGLTSVELENAENESFFNDLMRRADELIEQYSKKLDEILSYEIREQIGNLNYIIKCQNDFQLSSKEIIQAKEKLTRAVENIQHNNNNTRMILKEVDSLQETCDKLIEAINEIGRQEAIRPKHRKEIASLVGDIHVFLEKPQTASENIYNRLEKAEQQFKNDGYIWGLIRPILNALIEVANQLGQAWAKLQKKEYTPFLFFKSKAQEQFDSSKEIQDAKALFKPNT